MHARIHPHTCTLSTQSPHAFTPPRCAFREEWERHEMRARLPGSDVQQFHTMCTVLHRHYTASGRSAVDGSWYNFNDASVREPHVHASHPHLCPHFDSHLLYPHFPGASREPPIRRQRLGLRPVLQAVRRRRRRGSLILIVKPARPIR